MMSEIQRLPPVVNPNPVHPNAKTTTQMQNGTTTTKTNISSPVCRNCKTQTTPLWRRDETGQVLCNACGLFLKLHGRPRPISLKTDTIKLRNRIKQPNFSKLLGPNTPELKSKDAKVALKKLPKSAKKKAATLPDVFGVPNVASPLQHPRFGYPQQPGHFANLPHQVQLLHYPLSTPTQFAPGLQRITSPLLLLTSLSVLNARSTTHNGASPKGPLLAAQAAGALENMLNELGPSATFKGAGASSLNGVSLLGNSKRDLSTPSTALKGPPKLPALGLNPGSGALTNIIPSPSFGPQFQLDSVKQEPVEQPKTALPPLQRVSSAGNAQLPHFQSSFASVASGYDRSGPSNSNSTTPNMSGTPVRGSHDEGDDDKNDKSNGDGLTYELTLLKTRISELELVNDLYRTRIMELEAMEQAARLRESSMRKRLDEILALQGQDASLLNSSLRALKREGDSSDGPGKRARTDS